MNDLTSLNNDKDKNLTNSLLKSHKKIRSTSKNKIYWNSQNSTIKSKESKTNEKLKTSNNLLIKGIERYIF